MGNPLARPFASVRRSGRTPSCSNAKNEPVRPTPVCTSSKQRSGESSAAAATNSRSSGTTPPSPRIGSRRIRPTSSSTAAISASTSFGETKRIPGTSGANGARFAGCPVTESAPNVRPWNPPSSATTPGLPVALRAYLTAASIASAPELQKKDCAPPKRSESAAASCSAGSVRYRFETCHNRSSCACAAASGAGWQWPSDTTAMPPPKSRYSRPSESQTRQPSPRTIVRSARAYVGRSRSSRVVSVVVTRPPPSRRSRR